MTTPEQLLSTLQTSPFWKERREAAFALGYHKTPEVVDALMDALNDPDDDVEHAAIVALGNVGDESAVEHLLLPRFVSHPSVEIRWATLRTIGRIGHICMIPDIADLTNDEEWVVRNEALKLIRKQTESLLEHCSAESARRIVSLLSSDNDELRAIILDALLRIGPRIKPFLREAARSGGAQTQAAMAYILGNIRDKESVPLLIDLLDSLDIAIRKNALEALGRISDVKSLPAMMEKFGDPSREIQLCAVSAIAKLGKTAITPLHEQLHFSSRKTIQRNILFTLAKIRDLSSIPYFIQHLGSTYFIVRRAAITGLVQYGKDAIESLQQVIRNVCLPMIDDLLKQAETGATIGIRVRGIRSLGALADHRAVHLLKKLAAHEEEAIQKAALEALALIGCSCWQRCGAMAVLRELRIAPDVDLIIEQLSDDSENVRWRAIQVLARGGKIQALPALLKTAVSDSNIGLRYEALRGADELSPADSKVVEIARSIMNDPKATSHLLAEAARILGRSPDERHIPSLIECLKNSSWEVRRNAALALGNMGNMALPALMERLSSKNELELESVIRAIGNVGAKDALPVIEKLSKTYPDQSVVYYAARKAIQDIQKRDI